MLKHIQESTEVLAESLPKEKMDREKPSPMTEGLHEKNVGRSQS